MVLATSKISGATSAARSVARRFASKAAPAATSGVTGDIVNNLPRFLKPLAKLKDGETLNTLVTAVGTALVAPIFIAFNPLSKEDKETKIYSAMRQPISAIIAVGAQLGIASQFNKWVSNLAKNNKLDVLNNLGTKEAAKKLKSIQKYGGIAVTLATLPITCGILNWVYPRFMEKFMPEIANAKKNKSKETMTASTAPATATQSAPTATATEAKEAKV